MTVHLHAVKENISGLTKEEAPQFRTLYKNLYLLIPLASLVIMLAVFRLTVSRAGIYTILITIFIVSLNYRTRITWPRLKRIINGSIAGATVVAIPCAVVGIISGVVIGSGLSFRLASLLIDISGGYMPILLVLTMICSLILGMGLSTTACYLLLAVLVAPALVKMGVTDLAAHLFIFYYGIISSITPPVALASYAAAGIANCDANKCGWVGFKLAMSGFILPFMFIYNPVLLMIGDSVNIIIALITSIIGIYCLSGTLEGFFYKWHLSFFERFIIAICSILLIKPGLITDIIGACILIFFIIYRTIHKDFTQIKTQRSS
jgi:TRAP transporter 4TM/12TM fusion protein